MRKLASIQRIWQIAPIEGADRIELANVLGWQCVVNKGQRSAEFTDGSGRGDRNRPSFQVSDGRGIA